MSANCTSFKSECTAALSGCTAGSNWSCGEGVHWTTLSLTNVCGYCLCGGSSVINPLYCNGESATGLVSASSATSTRRSASSSATSRAITSSVLASTSARTSTTTTITAVVRTSTVATTTFRSAKATSQTIDASATSAAVDSDSTAVSDSSNSSSDSGSGISIGVIVGIVIALLALIIGGGLCYYFFVYKKKNKNDNRSRGFNTMTFSRKSSNPPVYAGYGQYGQSVQRPSPGADIKKALPSHFTNYSVPPAVSGPDGNPYVYNPEMQQTQYDANYFPYAYATHPDPIPNDPIAAPAPSLALSQAPYDPNSQYGAPAAPYGYHGGAETAQQYGYTQSVYNPEGVYAETYVQPVPQQQVPAEQAQQQYQSAAPVSQFPPPPAAAPAEAGMYLEQPAVQTTDPYFGQFVEQSAQNLGHSQMSPEPTDGSFAENRAKYASVYSVYGNGNH